MSFHNKKDKRPDFSRESDAMMIQSPTSNGDAKEGAY